MNHFIPPANTYTLQDTAGDRYLFGDNDSEVIAAHNFMRLVTTTDMMPYVYDANGRVHRTTPIALSLGRLGSHARLFTPELLFEPNLHLLFRMYAAHQISQCEGLGARHIVGHRTLVANVFEDFIKQTREVARVERVRHQQANWESKYTGNYEKLLKLEQACFERSGRLVVVFMHLHLREWQLRKDEVTAHQENIRPYAGLVTPYDTSVQPIAPSGAAAFDALHTARTKFFANVKGRPSVFRHVLGYAWRMGFAPQAGYHMHALFFFDGFCVDDPVHQGDQVGGFWVDVSDGRGRYRNGNSHPDEYNPWAPTGLIDACNQLRRAALRDRLLRPMAQIERAVVPPPFKGAHLFGSSTIRKRKGSEGANHHRQSYSGISEILIPQLNQPLSENAKKIPVVVVPPMGRPGGRHEWSWS